MKKMLLIVDPQIDFINGSLTVEGAEDAMNRLCDYIGSLGESEYKSIIITCDWHPSNHSSFKEWPIHCVQHSVGAAIHEKLWKTINSSSSKVDIVKVYTKGDEVKKEEYSVLQNIKNGSLLLKDITIEGIEQVDVCGIAGDFCVLNTIKDLVKYGHKEKLNVLLPFIASIDGGEKLNNFIKENQIKSV